MRGTSKIYSVIHKYIHHFSQLFCTKCKLHFKHFCRLRMAVSFYEMLLQEIMVTGWTKDLQDLSSVMLSYVVNHQIFVVD